MRPACSGLADTGRTIVIVLVGLLVVSLSVGCPRYRPILPDKAAAPTPEQHIPEPAEAPKVTPEDMGYSEMASEIEKYTTTIEDTSSSEVDRLKAELGRIRVKLKYHSSLVDDLNTALKRKDTQVKEAVVRERQSTLRYASWIMLLLSTASVVAWFLVAKYPLIRGLVGWVSLLLSCLTVAGFLLAEVLPYLFWIFVVVASIAAIVGVVLMRREHVTSTSLVRGVSRLKSLVPGYKSILRSVISDKTDSNINKIRSRLLGEDLSKGD